MLTQAAWRTLELRHYDVQLQGALALSAGGTLAQMGTGEGKTLVATCAVSATGIGMRQVMRRTAGVSVDSEVIPFQPLIYPSHR